MRCHNPNMAPLQNGKLFSTFFDYAPDISANPLTKLPSLKVVLSTCRRASPVLVIPFRKIINLAKIRKTLAEIYLRYFMAFEEAFFLGGPTTGRAF